MGRAAQFAKRVLLYGDAITCILFPDTSESNKCSCWEFGWANPDCETCGGSGYLIGGETVTIKGFVQPREQSWKANQEIIGFIPGGDGRVFFSGDTDVDAIDEITWHGDKYKLSNRDKEVIKDEVIYRVATIERVENV